eukprot:Lankesteria_metandrocarpae@DN7466_c0_g1_i1.p1
MELALRKRLHIKSDVKLEPLSTAELADEAVLNDDSTWQTSPEVVLDGCRLRALTEASSSLLAAFSDLNVLCLNQCVVTRIEAFPILPKLQVLELQDNGLTDDSGIEHLTGKLPALVDLSLAGNKLSSLDKLLPVLQSFKSLRRVDVELNTFAINNLDYRSPIFNAMPNLSSVDGRDRNGTRVDDDDDDDDDENDEDTGTATGTATGTVPGASSSTGPIANSAGSS